MEIIKHFNSQPVRVAGTPERPLFVAADVCRILEIGNTSEALRGLEDDERSTISNPEGRPGQPGALTFNVVTESGLYALIFKSRKPEAKAFRKWVTSEVLPAIRKTGGYSQFSTPQTLSQALLLASQQAAEVERLALENASMKPKADFVDQYVESEGDKTFRQVCKLLGANEREFSKFLVDAKVRYKLNGEWVPFQPHIEAKRFSIKTGVSKENDHAFNQTKFTPKGVEWIAGLWGQHKVKQELATV